VIHEIVELNVKRAEAQAFEEAFRNASPLIAATNGYRGHTLRRSLESPGRYFLQVEWDTVESHTVNFRQSPLYAEWKALLHHFYNPLPVVEHFEEVSL
jgi:heme-degrading monooxygenase HmoA